MNTRSHAIHRLSLLRSGLPSVLLGAGLLLALAGCLNPAPPAADAGAETILRHNWWNYYARGTERLKQGRVSAAADDFRRSLGLLSGARFGNDCDRWRARTYGLHFVEGYFPNRELGVCLYEQQDFSGAVRHLERSLRQAPSGRAKHYLNLARARLLAGQDLPGPSLSFDIPEKIAVPVRDAALDIAGVADGPGRIRSLAVGGRAEFIELALEQQPFARRIPLAEGTNTIEVLAEDLLGRRARRSIMRIADRQPPAFLVRRVAAAGDGWLVEGIGRDGYGVASVSVNGARVEAEAASGSGREVPLRFQIPAAGATLCIEDVAGNRLTVPLSAPGAGLVGEKTTGNAAPVFAPMAWAPGLDPLFAADPDGWRFRRLAGTVPVDLTVPSAPAGEEADRLRPALVMRGCRPLVRVYAEDFYIDGTASDGGGLARVAINGENLLSATDAGALRAYFARRLPLDFGTNRFEIAAIDRSGNRTAQAVTVVRLLPEHLDSRYRLTVGVPPLIPAGAGAIGLRVKRRMEAELTREPVRFRLLERDEGWDYVLREQRLSLSDLADPAAALRIGKLLPAEWLLMGTVFIEAKGITVYLRTVDTENGEIALTSDVYSPDDGASLDDAVAGLVLKVGQGFPLVSGEVRKRTGSRVVLTVGRADGATEKSRFLVYAAEAPGEDARALCRTDGRPVELHIDRLRQTTSTARVMPADAEALVKEGCHVYSR